MKGGGIRRYNRPERDFLMVHRSFARLSTEELSMRGRTVGLYVLSHDHGYVLTQESIASRLKLAVRTVAEALKDLEAAGLLVRIEERNARGHRTGTAMHVSDVPFTDDERSDLLGSLPAKSADAESADAESAGHKKSNSKQESKSEEDQPSGGDGAAAPPAGADEEAPMPKAASNQGSLFDTPAPPKKPRKAPKLPDGAAAVVAAFVESFGTHHGGRRPLGSDIGKVGQAARLILNREEATQEQLVLCAQNMGRGEWSNLSQELKFLLARSSGGGAMPRAMLADDPAWESVPSSVEGEQVSPEEFAELFGVGA